MSDIGESTAVVDIPTGSGRSLQGSPDASIYDDKPFSRMPKKVWENVLSRVRWVPRIRARAVCYLCRDAVPQYIISDGKAFTDLPKEVWKNILSRLHWVPRIRARSVCRLIRDVVPLCFDDPQVITLNDVAYWRYSRPLVPDDVVSKEGAGTGDVGAAKSEGTAGAGARLECQPFGFDITWVWRDGPLMENDATVYATIRDRFDHIASYCTSGVVLNIRDMFRESFRNDGRPEASALCSGSVLPKVVAVLGSMRSSLDLAPFINIQYLCLTFTGTLTTSVQLPTLPTQAHLKAIKFCNMDTGVFAVLRIDRFNREIPGVTDLFLSFRDPCLFWDGAYEQITCSLPEGAFPALKNVYLRIKPYESDEIKPDIADRVVTIIRSFEGCPSLENVKLVVTKIGKTEEDILRSISELWNGTNRKLGLILKKDASVEWCRVERQLGVFINPGEVLRNGLFARAPGHQETRFGQSAPVPEGFDPYDVDDGEEAPDNLVFGPGKVEEQDSDEDDSLLDNLSGGSDFGPKWADVMGDVMDDFSDDSPDNDEDNSEDLEVQDFDPYDI